MHSAFLLTSDGWRLSRNTAEILDHDGEAVFNEDDTSVHNNAAMIGARENCFATLLNGKLVLTATQLYQQRCEEARTEARLNGQALIRNLYDWQSVSGVGPKKLTVSYQPLTVTHYSDEPEADEDTARRREVYEKWRGFVAIPDGNFTRLVYDELLWQQLEKAMERQRRKWRQNAAKAMVTNSDMHAVAAKCSRAIGTGTIHHYRIWSLLPWLLAHDAAKGVRATNKIALELAKRWMKQRERHKKWLATWVDKTTIDLLDARLAKVIKKSPTRTARKETQELALV